MNNVEVNVTAYKDLLGEEGTLYDGDVVLGEGSYTLSEGKRATDPGFLRNLDDVAEEVKEVLIEISPELLSEEGLTIRYHSEASKDSSYGSRGYTASHGSYSRRPLTDSEMETLIRNVDSRLRPFFQED
jgi:hypothetical protein